MFFTMDQTPNTKQHDTPRWVVKLLDPCAPLSQKTIIVVVAYFAFVGIGLLCEKKTGLSLFANGTLRIYLQYPVLSLAALSMNPIAAFGVGFLGHLTIDFFLGNSTNYLGLCLGSGTFGLVISLLSHRWNVVQKTDATLNGRRFFAVVLLASIIAWPVVSTVFCATLQGITLENAFTNCVTIGLTDFIITIAFDAIIVLCIRRNYLAPVVGILLVAAMFVFSYKNTGIGSIILYILAAAGCVLTVNAAFLAPSKSERKRLERTLSTAAGIFIIAFVSVAVFFTAAEIRYAPSGTEKAVVVLGCSLNGSRPGSILASRLDVAKEFADEHPDTVIVVSGGKGETEEVSEAQAMRDYLVEKGISGDRVYMEDKSTTTAENLKYSLDVLRGLGFDEKAPIAIATSSPHCFRANRLALQCGFDEPRVLGAYIPWTMVIPEYARELLAIGKFLVVDGG